jgi:CRP-like cAMP-binding protein
MRFRVHRQWDDAKVEALARSRELGWMAYDELKALAPHLAETTVPEGVTVITEGRPNPWFFLLTEGILESSRGGRHTAFLRPGESCGATAAGKPETATLTVRSVTAVRLLVAHFGLEPAAPARSTNPYQPTAIRRLIAAMSLSASDDHGKIPAL